MEDGKILELFYARSEQAIRETEAKYGDYCYSVAIHILENRQDAQECVSDTYLRAWDTIPPTRPVHFFAYLAKLCRHFAFGRLDWNNAAKRKAEVIALTREMEECIPAAWQGTGPGDGQVSELVGSFLREQTQENRMIFVRRYWYGDSAGEIARRYGITESAVLMRLSRTRSKLASYLKQEGIYV